MLMKNVIFFQVVLEAPASKLWMRWQRKRGSSRYALSVISKHVMKLEIVSTSL